MSLAVGNRANLSLYLPSPLFYILYQEKFCNIKQDTTQIVSHWFFLCVTVSYKKKRGTRINSDHDRGSLGGQAEAGEGELWEGGQSGHPELRSRVGLSPSPPPSKQVSPRGHRCLDARLGLALTPTI